MSFFRLLVLNILIGPAAFLMLVSSLALADMDSDQLHYQDEMVSIEWLSADTGVSPGGELLQAFRVNLTPGWHIYWRNPGDSGLPPKIYKLEPEDWVPSGFFWPGPERIKIPPFVNFGYENEVFLPYYLAVPDDLSGENVRLLVELDWLVCEVECIPGSAEFFKVLPISHDPAPSDAYQLLNYAADMVPEVHHEWRLVKNESQFWTLTVDLPSDRDPSWTQFDFFPYEGTGVQTQNYEYELVGESLTIRLPVSQISATEEFGGVLWLGATVSRTETGTFLRLEEGYADQGTSLSAASLLSIMLLAFVGGLILNLMPCVLPVLSIKIMQLLGHGRDDRRQALRAGLMYTFGVLVSFIVLASVLILIKAFGSAAGWGFQLQSPYFVGFLACLFFFLGLNFLGLVSPWDSLTRMGNLESKSSGLWPQFSSGVLAVIVASPCTAPFMGVSIGFALANSAWVALLVFISLAMGFALPFLLLGIFPQGLKLLPKPGAWMETLRQFMAFPLFGTVLWLLWVLGIQTGSDGLILILLGFLVLSFAAWLDFRVSWQRKWPRLLNWTLGLLLTLTILRSLPSGGLSSVAQSSDSQVDTVWQRFSPDLVAELRADQRPVFIDFTAAWCVTCQVNKRVVLNRRDVMDSFAKHDFQLLQADWTDYDPIIGKTLESFGRNGVPLYVIYPANGSDEVFILPEILTPDLVLSYIDRSIP